MEQAVARVKEALRCGELRRADLTARKLGSFLGKTTSVLYHHWGSLDGFLHAVMNSAMVDLAGRIDPAAPIEDLAVTYVEFALEAPVLYELMFSRELDWSTLRESHATENSPGLLMFHALAARMEFEGSDSPADDARILYAGLHGLATLAITGRINVGEIETSDREVALRAARRLVRHVLATRPETPSTAPKTETQAP